MSIDELNRQIVSDALHASQKRKYINMIEAGASLEEVLSALKSEHQELLEKVKTSSSLIMQLEGQHCERHEITMRRGEEGFFCPSCGKG